MPNYNDFDLDIRRTSVDPSRGANAINISEDLTECSEFLTISCDFSAIGCTQRCTENFCTAESCSDCHSYCGSACR